MELSHAGVHRPTQKGICGTAATGAESIVVSGGYEDDLDLGDTIIYTGQGGLDDDTRLRVADQTIDTGANAAMVRSQYEGLPVRVVKAVSPRRHHAGSAGYVYRGLYTVEDHWFARSREGFTIVQFRLERVPWERAGSPAPGAGAAGARPASGSGAVDDGTPGGATVDLMVPAPTGPVERRGAHVERQVRDRQLAKRVKEIYDYRCQFCGTRLQVDGGPVAEAAHVRALGRPHDGPDTLDNLLCLCPNCHVRFDQGGLVVLPDLRVLDRYTGQVCGTVTFGRTHRVRGEHFDHHRRCHGDAPMPRRG